MLFLAALPARAQDGKIRVVNKDGSVTEFVIPKDESAMRVALQEPADQQRREATPVDPNPGRKDFLSRLLQAEEKALEPASVTAAMPAVPAGAVVKEEISSPPAAPRRKDVVAAKSKSVPAPARKPDIALHQARAAAASYDPEPPPAPGETISRNKAIGIAVRHAPPASDFRVFQAMHNDRPVYSVIFKTEKGDREVLVDAFTGDVVKK